MTANIYDEPFFGPSGEPITGMYQTKGGAVQLLYGTDAQSAVAEGSTGADIRYAHNVSPGTRSYRVASRAAWLNPGATAHILRVFARYDRANKNGYYVQLDSNFGAPEFKLFRLVNGTAQQLGSTVTPAALTALQDVVIEVEVTGSTIRGYYGGNADPDAPDIEVTDEYVYHQGFMGVGLEHSTDTGGGTIVIKHLESNSVYETGTLLPSAQGTLLKVDGESYDLDDLAELGITIQELTKTTVGVDELSLRESKPFTAPTFRPEQIVELFVDINNVRTRVFHGKIRNRPTEGNGRQEGVQYVAYGYRSNWQYVKIRHPETQSPQIVLNAYQRDPETLDQDPDYDARYSGMDIGTFLEKVIDEQITKIQQNFGCDPYNGQNPYVSGTFDDLTIVPPKTVVRGTLDSVLLDLIGYHPTRAVVVDYDLGQFLVRDLSSLTAKDISFTGNRVPRVNINLDTAKVFTAAAVTGVTEEIIEEEVSLAGGGLNRRWNTNLQSEWDQQRAKRRMQGFTVTAITLGGGLNGRDLITVTRAGDDLTFADEWKGTTLRVTSGADVDSEYQIFTNTGKKADGTYDIVIAGNFANLIAVSDTVLATDDMTLPTTNNRNGFFYIYRMWQVADSNLRNIDQDVCAKFNLLYDEDALSFKDGGEREGHYGDLPKDEGIGSVIADSPTILPEIGLINYTQNSGDCGVEEDRAQAIVDLGGDITFKFSYKLTSVARTRWPVADNSWYGPAFSANAALWEVADAVPEAGDLGLMREEDLEDSGFKYADQESDWLQILEERVKATSIMPWGGTIEYRGLDWENINFEYKLTLSSGKRTTGWEAEDLIPISWTWNFETNMNTVQVGTLSIYAREIDKAKAVSKLDAKLRTMEHKIEQFRQLQECRLKGMPTRDGSDPNPVPASRVKASANSSQSSHNSTSDHVNRTSLVRLPCAPAKCRIFKCDPKTIINPEQIEANARSLESITIESVVPQGWTPASGNWSVHRTVEYMRRMLACFMKDALGVFASHDLELYKAQVDFQNMGNGIGFLSDCIQKRIVAHENKINELIAFVQGMCWCLLYNDFKLSWCLTSKLDGLGSHCPINTGCCEVPGYVATAYCEWKFDPKICDKSDCQEDISIPDVPNEPD